MTIIFITLLNRVFLFIAHATGADVERGLTTFWETEANDHADKWAKAGARLHGDLGGAVRRMQGLKQLAMHGLDVGRGTMTM